MINVCEINKIETHRKKIRKEIYLKIYEQFGRKIRQQVEVGCKHVSLSVPSFVLGYPTFDRIKASVYLKRQLELNGFDVQAVSEVEFIVTWKQKTKEVAPREESIEEYPTLMNLKKAANKYRKNTQG